MPVGLFLSGGFDSTALLALSNASGLADIQTFCIAFEEEKYNEGRPASRTAKHFSARHHEWLLTPTEGAALVGSFLNSLDQPTIDGFNTWCVAKFARQMGMKVVMSGGGDELFGGYDTITKVPDLLKWYGRLRQAGLRLPFAYLLKKISDVMGGQKGITIARLAAFSNPIVCH